MRYTAPFFPAALLLLFLGCNHVALGDVPTAGPINLGSITPPGGAPLPLGEPGTPITGDYIKKATERLDSAPAEDLTKWVNELERITGKKLDSDLEDSGCRTYFVTRMSLAFDDLRWNARSADKLFKRAQTMPPSEAQIWKSAFAAVLKKEIERDYVVPLVLIPVEALHDGPGYSLERARKYLARLKQLTAEDVLLWKKQVDEFGGTQLDAAVNIILLDPFFDGEQFQRDRFRATVAAKKP